MTNPFIIEVNDYHEFCDVVRHFAAAGINVDYEEVGMNEASKYEAVFWTGEKTKEIVGLIYQRKHY